MTANQEIRLHNKTTRALMHFNASFPEPTGDPAAFEAAQAIENIVAAFSCRSVWEQALIRLALSSARYPNEASRILRQGWLKI